MRLLPTLAFFLLLAPAAAAYPGQAVSPSVAGRPSVAAAQVALFERQLYSGTIDGYGGPTTRSALRSFQAVVGLPPSGRLTVATQQALDQAPAVRSPLSLGSAGLRVAELQFRLAWHGFASGPFTTNLTTRVRSALMKFQTWASLGADGIAGTSTLAALAAPMPRTSLPLAWPLAGVLGDRFGPRGTGFHTGIDIAAPTGTPVTAAAAGVVVQAGLLAGGWGRAVTIDHGNGLQTLYAHLSAVSVKAGAAVGSGSSIGAVGATGDATGPHLHFEEQLRGAAIDPLLSLPLTLG